MFAQWPRKIKGMKTKVQQENRKIFNRQDVK
jgi:hypothetical protein